MNGRHDGTTITNGAAETTDSRNQPVRNCSGVAYSRKRSTPKVMKSKIEEPEDEHESLDEPEIPGAPTLDRLWIDRVGRDRHLGQVGQEVREQDLFRYQGQERQEERGGGRSAVC
jgi:hypothetical protein